MGFDNECILNIQSLPGEYFCPVCRTLIYPNEALQSQCTHLFCKPCLAYVVATTHACPYDGYLVTEADSKSLVESNKPLADTIGNVSVYCLFHRSGCQWQGTLSDCITHCTDCNFGDSPVVCNRCGTQIMHRQVQEHSLSCPGLQPQSQQAENVQPQTAEVTNQGVVQDSSLAASSAVATPAASTATVTAIAAVPSSAPAPAASVQGQVQGNAVAQPQTMTPEQWYQQQQLQYQQYYQQYPGYDPYQQQYQQYGQYPQQYVQQYPQPGMPVPTQHGVQAQQQPQPFMPPQIHPQPQAQPQSQVQPQPGAQAMQLQSQAQAAQPQAQVPVAQSQAQPQAQAAQPQLQHLPQNQSQQHPNPQHHPHLQPPQMQAQQVHGPAQQSYPQPQAPIHPPQHAPLPGHPIQPHPQAQPPQFQARPHSQLPQQHPRPQLSHQLPHAQHQPHPHPHMHPRPPLQQPIMQAHPQGNAYPHSQPQSVPQSQSQNPSSQAVTGHQSFPQPQPFQQAPPGSMQQRPMHMHPQPQPATYPSQPVQMQTHFPSQQPPQLRPSSAALPMQGQQQPAILPPQGPRPVALPVQQPGHHPALQPGQPVFPQSGMQPMPQQHAIPQQHMHGHLHPSQPYQPDPFPPQHVMQSQHPLRPQGPPLQQQIPPQSHMQQNGPSTQGLPLHQAHGVAGRPMVVSQGIPPHVYQQPPSAPAKFVQSGVTQQLPNQNYLENTTNAAISAKLQQGAMHQSQNPPSNSQEASNSASRLQSATGTNEGGQAHEIERVLAAKSAEGTDISNSSHPQMEGSVSVDLKISKNESYPTAIGDEAKVNSDVKENNSQPDLVDEDIKESAHLSGKIHDVKNEIVDEPVLKQVIEGEEGKIGSDIKSVEGDRKFQGQDGQSNGNVDTQGGGGDANLLSHDTQKVSQHIPGPGVLDPGLSQQSSASQHGFYDQNSTQRISQIPDPDEVRRIPLTGQLPGQDSFAHQTPPVRPPGMPGPPMSSQRPPAPNDMFPQHMSLPDPSQVQRFQGPPPNQMPFPPSQMRPPAPNFAEGLPHYGQQSVADALPPTGRQGYGSFHSDVAHAGLPGPVFPSAPPERIPGHLGPPPRGFEGPSGGARFLQGGPSAHPIMRGPPPRPLDMPGGIMARGPADVLEPPEYGAKRPGSFGFRQPEHHHLAPGEQIPYGQPSVGQSSAMKMNGKVPIGAMHDSDVAHGFEERFRHMPEERFKPLPEEGFHLASDERAKLPAPEPGRRIAGQREFEEDLKKFHRPGRVDEEGMSKAEGYLSSSMPMGRGPQAFGVNGLPPYQSGGPFSVGNDGSSFIPGNIGERHRPFGFHDDLSRRHDRAPVAEFGRRHIDALPPRRSPGREYSGHLFNEYGLGMRGHIEDLEARDRHGYGERSKAFNFSVDSLGNPFHEGRFPKPFAARSGAFHDVSGNLRMVEQFGSGLPGYKRNELDGSDPLHSHFRGSHMLGSRSRLRSGESLGHGNTGFGDLHSHSLFNEPTVPGDFGSNLRIREPVGGGNYPGSMRIGEPGFRSCFPLHGFPSEPGHYGSDDMDLELSRKRKPGTMGWCRICKIDCETVEGLDMHSQTGEHQKMAMDMVLSIKKENARKHKLTSESTGSPEDASKSKKANCEIRGN